MEEWIISRIEATVFGKTNNVSDAEFRVRLQNAGEYARELMTQSADKTIKSGTVQLKSNGIFIHFEQGIPNDKELGTIINKVSKQYPVIDKKPDKFDHQKTDGTIRFVVSTEGLLLVISRVAPPGNGKWLISAFILFLVEMAIFAMFVRHLSPAKDFASIRLYFNRG